jgi:hypothetical protein
LGYKQGVKGCILFDLITKETFISRNVTHHDHILPYHTTTTPTTPWQYHTVLETISPDTISPDTDPTNQHNTNPVHDTQHSTSPTLSHTPDSSSDTNPSTPSPHDTTSSTTHDNSIQSPDNTSSDTLSTRPTRVKHKPSYL